MRLVAHHQRRDGRDDADCSLPCHMTIVGVARSMLCVCALLLLLLSLLLLLL